MSDKEPLVDQVQKILGRELAVVVDVTGSTAAQRVTVDLVRRAAARLCSADECPKKISFVMDKLASRGIKIVGVRAHESEDVRKAIPQSKPAGINCGSTSCV